MFLTHLFFTTHEHEDESSTSVSSVTLKVFTCCTTCTVKEMFATSQRVHFISSEDKSDEGNTAGMTWQGSQVHEDPDRDASKEVSQTIPFPWERDSRTSILVPCHCETARRGSRCAPQVKEQPGSWGLCAQKQGHWSKSILQRVLLCPINMGLPRGAALGRAEARLKNQSREILSSKNINSPMAIRVCFLPPLP